MSQKLQTKLIHAAHTSNVQDPYVASHFPIYQTATFDIEKQQGNKVYDYSRSGNPTRERLEELFVVGEGGKYCVCTHTGIGAVAVVLLTILKPGAHVLVEKDSYSGTNRLLRQMSQQFGVQVHIADFTDTKVLEDNLQNFPISLVICESPTNPYQNIIDIAAVAQLAHQHKALFAVDNSMATFLVQQPLQLGADISFFSTTKFISGHGATIAGAIVTKSESLGKQIAFTTNAYGYAQGPFDAFLISLGIPTIQIRMKAQERTAFKMAEYLETHPKIETVLFPGLASHPQHELAKQQMSLLPGIVTLVFRKTSDVKSFITSVRLFGVKHSFGATDSRLQYLPGVAQHITKPSEAETDIGNRTVRLSLGLEDPEDLLGDLQQALA